MMIKFFPQIGIAIVMIALTGTAMGHGLMVDPPARNAYCGLTEKPDNAVTPACVAAFETDFSGGYQFMSVLTHTTGRAGGTSENVCGFDSETWKGEATPWDQPLIWPTTPMSAGRQQITWNISWGPHYDDTEEFRYYITKTDFVYKPGVALRWDDFESEPFCVLKYDDKNPAANPDVIPDKNAALFRTTCNVPQRQGRHVIYGEWGRNHFTYERFHGCIDVAFASNQNQIPAPAPESTSPPAPTEDQPEAQAGNTPSSPPASMPEALSANCEHVVTNAWDNGFQGAIRIINTSDKPIRGWEVKWQYTDGSALLHHWAAKLGGSNPYTAANLEWNTTIYPGQRVEFGFIGSGTPKSMPRVTGDVCDLKF